MFSKFTGWFTTLSRIGKIGFLTAAGVSTIAATTVAAGNTVTTKNETKTVTIPFSTTYQEDDTMLINETKIIALGIPGSKLVTYRVTFKNGIESKREVQKEVMKIKPSPELVKRGTKEVIAETADQSVPYDTKTVIDTNLDRGVSIVTTSGANGSKKLTYEVVKVKSVEVSRRVIKEEVMTIPTTRVITLGSKVKAITTSSRCDPNYSGACVPVSSDVDCGSGNGNGPAYAYETVRVIGSDIYDLDSDGDGYGCD